MPRRNRVTPFGELVDAGRGLVYGNRGCLHDEQRQIRRRYAGEALDRLPARVPRLEADAAAAAGPVHGAVLPGRGDRLRRRPPPVRPLPLRGLPELCDTLARASPGRRRRRRTRSTRGCTRSEWSRARAAQRRHAAPFETLPDGAFVALEDDALPRARRPAAAVDARRLRGLRRAPGRAARPTCSRRRRSSPCWRRLAGSPPARSCTLRRSPAEAVRL